MASPWVHVLLRSSYLPGMPYHDNATLHEYAGMIALYLAQGSRSQPSLSRQAEDATDPGTPMREEGSETDHEEDQPDCKSSFQYSGLYRTDPGFIPYHLTLFSTRGRSHKTITHPMPRSESLPLAVTRPEPRKPISPDVLRSGGHLLPFRSHLLESHLWRFDWLIPSVPSIRWMRLRTFPNRWPLINYYKKVAVST